jgi:hypothetical protein
MTDDPPSILGECQAPAFALRATARQASLAYGVLVLMTDDPPCEFFQ